MELDGYFAELTANIRARPISWDAHQRAGSISVDNVRLIKSIDKQRREKRNELVEQNGSKYATLVLALLQGSTRADILQYTLVLMDDLITDLKSFTQTLLDLNGSDHTLPFQPIQTHLSHGDETVQILTAEILSRLLSSTATVDDQIVQNFFDWSTTVLSGTNSTRKDLAIQSLATALRSKPNRLLLWNSSQKQLDLVIALLRDISQTTTEVQLQYHILLLLWLLSFEEEISENIQRQFSVLQILITIVRTAIKEKIVRLVFAVFKNLVQNAPKQNVPVMIGCRLLPLAKSFKDRKWIDQEIVEDIGFLVDRLQKTYDEMTTFDEYASEVESGRLAWTPPHKSHNFWKENAPRLLDNNKQLLKALSLVLTSSQDALVLAVASHDIGEFVKNFPQGRTAVQELGAKTKIMQLMTHSDADVRYEALNAVQNLMSYAWHASSHPLPPLPPIDRSEVEINFIKGSGPGGQKINKTSSACQVKHLPTGIVVKSQKTRSRSINEMLALRRLAEHLDVMENRNSSRESVKIARHKRKKQKMTARSKAKYAAALATAEEASDTSLH